MSRLGWEASQAGAVVGSLCHAGCEVRVTKNIKCHRVVELEVLPCNSRNGYKKINALE